MKQVVAKNTSVKIMVILLFSILISLQAIKAEAAEDIRLIQGIWVFENDPSSYSIEQGQWLDAQFTAKNFGNQPATLDKIGIGGRAPDYDGGGWSPSAVYDMGFDENITLAPGEERQFWFYKQLFGIDKPYGTYKLYAVYYRSSDNSWIEIPPGNAMTGTSKEFNLIPHSNPQTLSFNTPTNEYVPRGGYDRFYIDVPTDAIELKIEITGAKLGNYVNLYERSGTSFPSKNSFDHAAETGTSNEAITINNPSSGWHTILVDGYYDGIAPEKGTPYAIKVTYQTQSTGNIKLSNISVPNPVDSSGGDYSLLLDNDGDAQLTWDTNNIPSWVTVSPDNGLVNGNSYRSVNISVQKNSGTNSRSANIKFYNKNDLTDYQYLQIQQSAPAAEPANLYLNSISVPSEIESSDARYPLRVNNGGEEELVWDTQNVPSWVTLTPESGSLSGGDYKTVSVYIGANTTTNPRPATIKFYNTNNTSDYQNLSFEQKGSASGTADLRLSDISIPNPVASSGGNYSLRVNNDGDDQLTWNANSVPSWVTLTPANGSVNGGGNKIVSVSVQAKSDSDSRTCTIKFYNTNNSSDYEELGINQSGVSNSEPNFISGHVNPSWGISGESFTFESTWNDPDGDFVVDVKVRYRKQGTDLWAPKILDFADGNPPKFSKSIQIDGPLGVYEYQFQASDANPASGPRIHTTSWKEAGTFEIKEFTANPPCMEFVRDVTVPDGTRFDFNQSFTKTWRVKNCGTDTWTTDYQFVFSSGDKLSAPSSVQIPHSVPPGGTVDISVPMRAPVLDNGTIYRTGYWKIKNPFGELSRYHVLVQINMYDAVYSYLVEYYRNTTGPAKDEAKKALNFFQSEWQAGQDVFTDYFESEYADPVNTAMGAHIIRRTLLGVNGLRPVNFQANYSSGIMLDGVMGKGWGHNFETRLEINNDGDAQIYWSANHFNRFIKCEDGSFLPAEPGVRFDTLTKNTDGTYTLTGEAGDIYDFNADGNLTSHRNRIGQTLTFDHDAQGRLEQVTEPVSGNFLRFSYNALDLLQKVTDTLNREVLFSYDSNGHLTGITDAAGNTTAYTYNDEGRILSATDAEGVRIFLNTYDELGRVATQDDAVTGNQLTRFEYDDPAEPGGNIVTTVTNRDGQTRIFTHTSDYKLLSVKDELGNTAVTYTYDDKGSRAAGTDANGNVTTFSYDERKNLISATDAAGSASAMTYDDNDNLLTVTDVMGKQISFTYDDQNRLTHITDPAGNAVRYTYDADGQLLTVTDTDGDGITYGYENGLLTRITDPEGNTSTLEYDAAGRIVSMTDAQGNTNRMTYNPVNRLIQVTDPLNRIIRMTYNSHGDLLTLTDAKGNANYYSYNGNGKLVSRVNALGHETRYEYNAEDLLTKVIDARGNAAQLGYDAKGRLTWVSDALGNTRELTYDVADNLLQQIDALGNVQQKLTYDALNNVTSVTDALNHTTHFAYDTLNRLTQITDPLNRVTQFNYDELDRLVKSVDVLNGESAQEFDSDGNRTGLTDPNGNQTGFSFDKNGRLVSETSAAGGSVSYTYNAGDLLASVTNARGQNRVFEYDEAGRLVRFTDPDGTVSYTYDANDNVLTVTDADGAITREYDMLDRIVRYTDTRGNTLRYAYDEVSNLTAITYPDGKQVAYEYDAADRLKNVTDWAGRETSYEYDANNRLIRTVRPNGTILTRTYNSVGQLTQQKDIKPDGEAIAQYDFSYDSAGNITLEQITPAPNPFSLPPANMTYNPANRLATYNGESVTYDADGNMVQGPLKGVMGDFQFDSRNRLITAGTTAYSYDAESYRIGVTENGVQTSYVINPEALLSQALVKTDSDETQTLFVYGLGLIGQEREGAYLTYHFDLRGSTVALSDEAGQVMDRFQYSPYAGLVNHTGTNETSFLYNGRDGVMSDGNGLYYMRARYYNPVIRQFVNQDVLLGVIAYGKTLNRYTYVEGNPINYIDSLGMARVGAFSGAHATGKISNYYGEESCKKRFGRDWEAECAYEYKIHVEDKWKARAFVEVIISGKANQIFAEEYVRGVEEVFVPTVTEGMDYSGKAIETIPIPQAQVLGKGLQKGSAGVNVGFKSLKTAIGKNDEGELTEAIIEAGIKFIPGPKMSKDNRLKKWVNPSSEVWMDKTYKNMQIQMFKISKKEQLEMISKKEKIKTGALGVVKPLDDGEK